MKRKMLNGYWIVYVPEHYGCMRAKNYNGWEYEHRYVMEIELGRKLGRFEVVHHKNGNKLDNRLENLKLMTLDEHTSMHSNKHLDYRCEVCGRKVSRGAKRCVKHAQNGMLYTASTEEIVESVSENGFEATGRKYLVSGTAVRKKLIRNGMTPDEIKQIRKR